MRELAFSPFLSAMMDDPRWFSCSSSWKRRRRARVCVARWAFRHALALKGELDKAWSASLGVPVAGVTDLDVHTDSANVCSQSPEVLDDLLVVAIVNNSVTEYCNEHKQQHGHENAGSIHSSQQSNANPMDNAAPGTEIAKNTTSHGNTHSSRETIAKAMVNVAASDDIASASAKSAGNGEELYRAIAARRGNRSLRYGHVQQNTMDQNPRVVNMFCLR